MKKLLLSIFCITLSFNIYASHSRLSAQSLDFKNAYKEELFSHQIGLMDKQQYYTFIAPYLTEAEQTLEIPKSSTNINHQATTATTVLLFNEYLNASVIYNVHYFHHYVKPSSDIRTTYLNLSNEQLKNAITKLARDPIMVNLNINIQDELLKTTNLIQKANQDYYARLGLLTKLMLFFLNCFGA